MNPRYKISPAGIDFLKDFEGFRGESARLPDGRWTIGYGHTKSARAGVTISESDASALLQYDLIEVVKAVNDLVFTPLTQNQFDSLVCFAFNVGLDAFRGSTVLRRINEGSMLQAAWSLEMWRKAEFEGHQFVVDALVRRRAAEKALFLTPPDGWVAAPSPVLPPLIDDDVCRMIPKEKPADLRACLTGATASVVREDAPVVEAVEPEPVAEPAPVHEAVVEAVTLDTPHEPEPEPVAEQPTLQMADATQAMSARLEAILPHAEAAAAGSQPDLDLPLAPAEPAPFERPVVQSRWLPDPIAFPQDESRDAATPPEPDLFKRPIFREEPHGADFETSDMEPAKLGFAPFLVLAFVGLIIFAAAATWAFNAHSSGGMVNSITIGIGMAIVGIGCVVWAVYSLLSKFGDWEE